jgi:hypothetical protein
MAYTFPPFTIQPNPPVVTLQKPANQSQPCSMSVTTLTDVNGTHRHFFVTCTESGYVSAALSSIFSPGSGSVLSAYSSMFTVVSIVSAVGVALVAIVFQGEILRKAGVRALIPSVSALWAFSFAIGLTVFYSLMRPLSGVTPPLWGIQSLIVLTLSGLGLCMFALAGIVRSFEHESQHES